MSADELDPDKLAQQCAARLAQVDENIRWAYSAGWFPGRRWVGEPRGAAMHLAGTSTNDNVPGPTDDIGMGDYAARRAVRSAGPRLVVVSRTVGEVVEALAIANRCRSVPACVAFVVAENLRSLLRASRQIGHQLDRLDGFEVLNAGALSWATAKLVLARDGLAALDRSLGRWGDNLPENRDLPVAMCVTCERRPRPIRRGVVVGRECDTCATYRHRHKGQARPKALDKDDRLAVAEAQKRRAAAGQGWGWS